MRHALNITDWSDTKKLNFLFPLPVITGWGCGPAW